jgi:hypothetical protein
MRTRTTALLQVHVLTGPSHLGNWQTKLNWSKRLPVYLFLFWGGPKCRYRSQQFTYCCDCWLPWKSCLSGCCLDTDLHKPCLGSDLTTCGRIPWKASAIVIVLREKEKIANLLELQISLSCRYLISHWSKYLLTHPALMHPPSISEIRFTTIQKHKQY